MNCALYTKTEYSMLNNTIKLEDLIVKALEYGYKSLSITDKSMHGAYKFYKLCVKNNIKPIIGIEAKIESKYNVDTKILLYCKNNIGYNNLIKISSIISAKGIITLEELKKFNKGIIAISCDYNDINYLLRHVNYNEAINQANHYKELFEEFYIGIEPQLINFDDISTNIINLANDSNIVILPLSQVLYLNRTEQEIYLYLRSVDLGKPFKDIENLPGNFHFKNQDELIEEFYDYQFCFDNLNNLINKIDVKIEKIDASLPIYPSNSELDSKNYLYELCILGLSKRLKKNKNSQTEYMKRLNYELDVINKMGYNDYFLIVFDFVRYAKKNKIYVGPGRGSAAGSLVSYCLGITDIDPLQYGLLFERFLNPERISMPDIDMDFPHNKRNEVIEYVIDKYGSNHISHIITFDCYRARGAIRDVAKSMEIEGYKLEEVLKHISFDENFTNIKPSLNRLMEKDPKIKELIKISKEICGLPRHTGTHAAGIILSRDSLDNLIPLGCDVDKNTISQYEASDLEELGLLKIDFLGLKNLTMIDNIVNSIKNDLDILIDIRNIELNDTKTYKFLCKGETTGLFQLESQGMRNVLKKLKPNNINDIIAVLALYRPGPMEYIDEYIERKNGKKYKMIHPVIDDILKETFGIIVYQEQIMQIASRFAGYSLGEADVLRRAISKKNSIMLSNEKNNFINRAIANNRTREDSEKIYDHILRFANYGFNKSHSVAYGIVAYQTAYLKANYSLYFMCELLNNAIGDENKTKQYIIEAKTLKINILGPDINKSDIYYKIENGSIRFPLLGIKGCGMEIVKDILKIKDKHTISFKNLNTYIPDRALEALVKAGAFDSFSVSKKTLIESIGTKVNFNAFLDPNEIIVNSEYDDLELIKFEKEVLGFNLTQSPLRPYNNIIRQQNITCLSEINDDFIDQTKNVIGFISKIKQIKTKTNENMAFFLASDGIIEIEGFIFPQVLSNIEEAKSLDVNKVYLLKTKIRKRNDCIQLELLDIIREVTL